MEFGFLSQAAKFLQDRKNDKRWRTVFLCLAATVAFGTVTALKLYGQAMTHKVKVLDCQYAVHEHTDDCYEKDENGDPTGGPVCGYADYVIHVHNDDCYREGELVCGLEEHELHEHDDSCYEETDVLVCEESESESVSSHQHTDACYTEVQGELTCEESTEGGHIHDDSCYSSELVCDLEEHSHGDGCYSSELACDDESEEHEHGDGCYSEELTCEQEEHSHGDECYREELTCGQEESTAHEHTDDCYGTRKELTCTLGESESVEGHTHDDSCYETEETLTCEELELHTHVEATEEDGGCYDESAFDGETGEFIEGSRPVCGIPQLEEHVHTEDCFQTVELTADEIAALNGGASLHIHTDDCYDEEGNLICGYDVTHIHNLECYDEQGNLICGFGEEEEEQIYYCGKEEHTHEESCYDENGELICGKEEHIHEESCLTADIRLEADTGDYVIILEASKDAFPEGKEGLTLEAIRLTEDTREYQETKKLVEELAVPEAEAAELPFEIRVDGELVTDLFQNTEEISDVQEEADVQAAAEEGNLTATAEDGRVHDVFDIRVLRDGEEVQPEVPVKVSFVKKTNMVQTEVEETDTQPEKEDLQASPETAGETEETGECGGEKIRIFHVDTENEMVEDMNAEADEDGNAVIDTPHFSTYDVTVDGQPGSAEILDSWEALANWNYDGTNSWGKTIEITLNKDLVIDGSRPVHSMWIDQGRKMTIDLNGHRIIIEKKNFSDNTDALFVVGGSGDGSLTIKDSKAQNFYFEESEGTRVTGEGPHRGSYENDRLTFCVSKSSPIAGVTGKTEEKAFQYTLDLQSVGAIENRDPEDTTELIRVGSNGTLIMESGRITNPHGNAIKGITDAVGVSVNLKGGYLVGNGSLTPPADGGAVDLAFVGGTVNIEDGVVITANQSNGSGGGIRTKGYDSGTQEAGTLIDVTMKGGIVSGNCSVYSGGGFHVQDGRLHLSGGFITDNYASGTSNADQGGGLALHWAGMDMTGGTIACNKAETGGGGISACNSTGGSVLITGGAIAGNRASVEGGGIRISSTYVQIGTMEPDPSRPIYLTNNNTTCWFNGRRDWGGGGMFIADSSGQAAIYNSIITRNEAGGFGGGVAGCSTGRIISVDAEHGAAIYDNKAEGSGDNLSGGGSSKSEDHDLAFNQPAFMQEGGYKGGYQDVFSALGSQYNKQMLGQGYVCWTGSCDYDPVNCPEGEAGYISSKRILGLSAHPGTDAVQRAEGIANVYITGNSSGTHGGGILCNGILWLGDSKTLYYNASLVVELQKRYQNGSGDKINLNSGDFQFQLIPQDGGPVLKAVNTAGNEADRTNVQFLLSYDYDGNHTPPRTGTYTYILEEIPGSQDSGIEYDSTKYKIEVVLQNKTQSLGILNGTQMEQHYLYIESVKLYRQKPGDTDFSEAKTSGQDDDGVAYTLWEYDTEHVGDYNGSTSYHGARLIIGKYRKVRHETAIDENGNPIPKDTETKLDLRPAFTNVNHLEDPMEFGILKTDGREGSPMNRIRFHLTELVDGKKIDADPGAGWAETGQDGKLTYTVFKQEKTYVLEESVPDGYFPAGPWIVNTHPDGSVEMYVAECRDDGSYHATGTSVNRVENSADSGIFCFRIVNNPEVFELPETGGMGMTVYTMAGALITVLGAGFLYKKKFRERRM